MKLKKTDRAVTLLKLIEAGIVPPDVMERLVSEAAPYQPRSEFLELSLADYQTYLNHLEADKVGALFFLMQKLDGVRNPRRKVKRMTIERLAAWLKFMEVKASEVKAHFDAIPKIPVSALVREAMKSVYDFGVYAIVDRMAVRHHITDEQAEQIPLIVAITKLKIDADAELTKFKVERAIVEETRLKSAKKH